MNLYDELLLNGLKPEVARKAIEYRELYSGDIHSFIRSVTELLERLDAEEGSHPMTGSGKDGVPIVSNHTGYNYEGSENFEHDNTASQMNYSGVEDDVNNAIADHEGWEKGYDYD